MYIGRPTKWANPYPLTRESMREDVSVKYELYMATRLINGDITQEDFIELRDKNLLCWCAPKRCHGDTIFKLVSMTHDERLKWANDKISDIHG